MMAAVQAAENGNRVLLLERNKSLGKKVLLTGNGRCNLTNTAELGGFIEQIPDSGKFLYNVFSQFFSDDLIGFLNKFGLKTKVENNGRVFPVTDNAGDVVDVFKASLKKNNVTIKFSRHVSGLIIADGCAQGVKTDSGEIFSAPSVIIAVGGMSYPETGSTGDGYVLAKQAQHKIIPPYPGLVGLDIKESFVKEVQGISLDKVQITLVVKGKKKVSKFGEMIFTHFGVSGPMILDISTYILKDDCPELVIDFMPGFSREELSAYIDAAIKISPIQFCRNCFKELLPKKFIYALTDYLGIAESRKLNQLTKKEKTCLISSLKALQLTVRRTRPLKYAMVTRGGVCVKEIDPKTMESKKVKGLYFCGEVLDIAGLTGGYNLQAAFSTGYAAGNAQLRREYNGK